MEPLGISGRDLYYYNEGYDQGYADGMMRAYKLVGQLIDHYQTQCNQEYLSDAVAAEGRHEGAIYAQLIIKKDKFDVR